VATVTPAAPVAPAPAPAPVPVTPPERPNVSVTGIIDTEGAPGMALISVASDQRIIQVGDVLPQNYRVKRIWNNGIELVNGRDRFFVALGEGSQAAKPAGKG